MKRGFLFGLGSFIALGVLGGIEQAFRGANSWYSCAFTLDDECHWVGSVILSIALCAPLSALVFWKAKAAAPNRSRLHAIGGWLIGFGFLPVVLPLIVVSVILAGAAILHVVTGGQVFTCDNGSCRF